MNVKIPEPEPRLLPLFVIVGVGLFLIHLAVKMWRSRVRRNRERAFMKRHVSNM